MPGWIYKHCPSGISATDTTVSRTKGAFAITCHENVAIDLWEVKDTVLCVDCGREARGYRIVRAVRYDRTCDAVPEFRCEECSQKKTEKLRQGGLNI